MLETVLPGFAAMFVGSEVDERHAQEAADSVSCLRGSRIEGSCRGDERCLGMERSGIQDRGAMCAGDERCLGMERDVGYSDEEWGWDVEAKPERQKGQGMTEDDEMVAKV